MNERDRLIGRLLLEKGLATREALQQAAAATTQRRSESGGDVETRPANVAVHWLIKR